jgi:pimeloyl-ACP methyl ester carboxylesterase
VEGGARTQAVAQFLSITAGDGRRLEVAVAGPENGDLLLRHGGTPSAAHLFEPMIAAGSERGLRQALYSRPGYGESDRHEGRTVADCVPDAAAIADELGAERFHTLGGSGGGPHALACAALLPERVISAVTIASGAPRDAEGLDWLAGMGQENLDEFGAAENGEEALRAYLEGASAELEGVSGPAMHEALGDLVSEVDRQALSGEFGEYLAASFHKAVAHGIWGWFDDDMAFIRDWGFELDSIAVPVAIWQGVQDRFVPYAHGEWLAGHVPGARPHLLAEHGHLSIAVGAYGEVLDDMLALGRA